jgi:hypothetical protein
MPYTALAIYTLGGILGGPEEQPSLVKEVIKTGQPRKMLSLKTSRSLSLSFMIYRLNFHL